MLKFDPQERFSAAECLKSKIFDEIRDFEMEIDIGVEIKL